MTKTIQDAFLQAVQTNKPDDARVLAQYGADPYKALWHFNNKKDLAAMKQVLSHDIDFTKNDGTLLLGYIIEDRENEDGLARFHLLLKHGVKPDHTTLTAAVRQNNMDAFQALIAMPEIKVGDFDLHKEMIGCMADDQMLAALVQAGTKLSVLTLNDYAGRSSQTVIGLHLQAGIKPTHEMLKKTLYAENPSGFDKMLAEIPKEEWTQDNLNDVLYTAVHMAQVGPFRTLIKMGAKVGSHTLHISANKAEEMQEWPGHFDNKEDVITLYKLCHRLARQKADPALCKMPEPREPVRESYYPRLRCGPL